MRLCVGEANGRLPGNLRDFPYQENVGDLDFEWVNEYGTAWRIGAPFGQDMLMVADPKVLKPLLRL